LDMVTTSANTNTVLFNDGTGVFTPTNQQLGASQTIALSLSDVDRDGDLDGVTAGGLVAVNQVVWLNQAQIISATNTYLPIIRREQP
ncbi:MAG: VCBS repeat-containing protein, partial [Okeania sp. SIO3B3]|nr:VCBS repeat-containing protein [Okeania sp. SIO3B3]